MNIPMTESLQPNASGRLLSWVCFVSAIAALVAVAGYIPIDRARLLPIFNDFEVELPLMTQIVYAIPTWMFPVVAVTIGIFLLVCQIRFRHGATVLHLLVLAGCFIGFELYREAKLAPLIKLIQSLS